MHRGPHGHFGSIVNSATQTSAAGTVSQGTQTEDAWASYVPAADDKLVKFSEGWYDQFDSGRLHAEEAVLYQCGEFGRRTKLEEGVARLETTAGETSVIFKSNLKELARSPVKSPSEGMQPNKYQQSQHVGVTWDKMDKSSEKIMIQLQDKWACDEFLERLVGAQLVVSGAEFQPVRKIESARVLQGAAVLETMARGACIASGRKFPLLGYAAVMEGRTS